MVDSPDCGRARAAPRSFTVLNERRNVPAWPAATVPALAAGDTHVWRLDLDVAEAEATRLRTLLSESERARADAFRFDRHRRRYVAGRGRLRELLAAYVGEEPGTLVLVEGANGKPELERHELRFNLAHSEAVGICAVATAEVGVDVEVVERERRPDWSAVAARFFHADEIDVLRDAAGESGWLDFLRIWTLKEACLKAIGVGLLTDPRSFSVAPVLAGGADRVTLAGATLRARKLGRLAGAVAALAVAT